jgi:oligopeptide/dipeptide ABC transporter ATP-binding protein
MRLIISVNKIRILKVVPSSLIILMYISIIITITYASLITTVPPINVSILTDFLLFFTLAFVITFFIFNWDPRSQLIRVKVHLYAISAFISAILIFIPLPESILGNFWILIITYSLLSVIISFATKYITFKIIRIEKFRQIINLKPSRNLLEVQDLKVHYPLLGGILKRRIGAVKAVDGVSFNVDIGETVGLVGESGCGKTTIAKAILGLVETTEGKVNFQDKPIPPRYSSYLRQKIQMIFQDPDASLNPRKKVIDIISDPLKNLLGITDKLELRKRVLALLEQVSLKREHLDRYPHEFSGGQKQRIVIARALACNPELIILDEPTSALDVSVQAQILNLLKDLQRDYGYGFLFITHNLAVVSHIADRVAVMYLGKFVEVGSVEQIFSNPAHPYTQALLASRTEIDPYNQEIKFVIKGEVPSPITPPSGCTFNPRCSSDARTKDCELKIPHKIQIEEGHYIWCNNPPTSMQSKV